MYRSLANRDPDNTNLHTHTTQELFIKDTALERILYHQSFGKDTSQELWERYCITRALGKILYHKSFRKDTVSQELKERYCITKDIRKILYHKSHTKDTAS